MRKVLLATTALVAITGVTAANADISISGSTEYHYTQPSSGSNLTEMDGNVTIKASADAGDTGVTYSVVYNQSVGQAAGVVDVEDIYIDINGDFGRLFLGQTDGALDAMDNFTGHNMTIEGHTRSAVTTALSIQEDTGTVNYISPSVNGVTLYGAVDDTNGKTGYGINYSSSMGTIGYQSLAGGGTEATMVMGQVDVAGITVGMASRSSTTDGAKTTSSDVGVNYSVDALAFSAVAQKSSNGAKTTTVGVQDTVAPGVYAQLEQVSDRTAAAVDSTSTFMALGVKF